MFRGGEVSGGHLAAGGLLVSLPSVGAARLSSSMVSAGPTGRKEETGEGEEKRE